MSTSMTPALHVALAMRIANRAVIADIESEGTVMQIDGARYYDVRPMLDPREHDAITIDMAGEALSYAIDAGVVTTHPAMPHLVRINHRQA